MTIQPPSPKIKRIAKAHVPIAMRDPKNPNKLIYLVPVQHRPNTPEPEPISIYTEDYEALYLKETCLRIWYAKKPAKGATYLTVTVKSNRRATNNEKWNHVPVSWLILGIWPEDNLEVRHMDGNRRNLRRDNLETRPSSAETYGIGAQEAKDQEEE